MHLGYYTYIPGREVDCAEESHAVHLSHVLDQGPGLAEGRVDVALRIDALVADTGQPGLAIEVLKCLVMTADDDELDVLAIGIVKELVEHRRDLWGELNLLARQEPRWRTVLEMVTADEKVRESMPHPLKVVIASWFDQ